MSFVRLPWYARVTVLVYTKGTHGGVGYQGDELWTTGSVQVVYIVYLLHCAMMHVGTTACKLCSSSPLENVLINISGRVVSRFLVIQLCTCFFDIQIMLVVRGPLPHCFRVSACLWDGGVVSLKCSLLIGIPLPAMRHLLTNHLKFGLQTASNY